MSRGLAVAIVSGGMDSVTLAYLLADQGYELSLVTVDYGQRHAARELGCARRCAERLGARSQTVDLRGLRSLFTGSALTDDSVEVPHGHYAAPNMAKTVVPNRNAILLSIGFAAAVAQGAKLVATAVHAGDHPVYPDCRPEFLFAFDAMEREATKGFAALGLKLHAPFMHNSKSDIVTIGYELEVPWADTWSCYEGGENHGPSHCGRCGTCVERREAFKLAGVSDPTVYADLEFARTVTG